MIADETDNTDWAVGHVPLRRTSVANYTTWWLTGPGNTSGTILCAHNKHTGAFFTGSFLPDGVYTRCSVNEDSLDLHVAAFLVLHEAAILAAVANLKGACT